MSVSSKASFFRDPLFPFHIDRYTIGRGESIPSHTHEFIELVYVLKGHARHEMAGHGYVLNSGDIFVLEPNVYHSYHGAEDEDTIVYNVLFDSDLLRRELEVLLQMTHFVHFFYFLPFLRKNASFVPHQSLDEAQKRNIEGHLQAILDEYQEQREGYRLVVKTRWIECLVWLSRYLQPQAAHSPAVSNDRERIEPARQFIEQHYRQNIALAQISRICGMSVSSFTAQFKEAVGKSFLDYKQELQIRHACELLAETDRKVLDIAYEAGFNDISFFNKTFRKHMGISPREYRSRR